MEGIQNQRRQLMTRIKTKISEGINKYDIMDNLLLSVGFQLKDILIHLRTEDL